MSDQTVERPQRIANLSVAEKRELLKNFLSLRNGDAHKVLPLSFPQQSLWVVHQLAPHSSAYNFHYAARITSALDEAAFGRAFQALVDRHPLLRCTFGLEDLKPIQRIGPKMTLHVAAVEAATWSLDELLAHMRAEADRPFDLERGPAWRISLYRRDQGEHALLLVFHHIIADGWSVEILLQELEQIYYAEQSGHQAQLPPPAAHFADFVRWQFANVYGPRGQKSWEYWQQELAGDLPVLQLPTDRPRPPVQTYNGNAFNWPLEVETMRRLRGLAKQHGATTFVALLAAFEVLLCRYSGQNRFFVGTPTADRGRPEWERLVGYFINQVVLRAQFDGGTAFARLLEDTRDRTHQAIAHQDYPFGLIVKRLQPKRDPGHPPLFQVMFVWDKVRDPEAVPPSCNGHSATAPCPPLRLETLIMGQRGGPFDLTLIIFETGDKFTASFRYNTDLFDEQTIVRMAGHFNTLLETLIEQPDMPLAELSLLTAAERQRLLCDWNQTDRPYPADTCFHQLVEGQAAATPEAAAAVLDNLRLTYRELNSQANRLARHLRQLGAGPDNHVALCMPRSPAAIIAILAAWKAGAAYVPLDPAYPGKRLAGMIEDARPAVLLTFNERLELPGITCPVLRWPELAPVLARLPDHNLDLPCAADAPAYIIFTSGSSGRPKGTLLHHRGLCNMSEAQVETFRTAPHDRVLQFASLSFDASVFEIAMALRVGACLVLANPAAQLPGPGLLGLLRECRVTNATLPPSVLAALPATDLPDLHTLIVAGEACSAEIVATWGKGRRFFNAYGPTETTVWATVAECQPDGRAPTIGRPIANTRVYVLDDYLQPVPVGVPGELCIAGPGLAIAYLNRPELTAEKFVPDPFHPAGPKKGTGPLQPSRGAVPFFGQGDGLMYRTGDLVRYREDGMLEFLARRDLQVKINGFRIETEEVQEVLRQHPGLCDAVVVARKGDARAAARLIAYVVPKTGDSAIDPKEIRGFLRERLPHFMLPSAIMVLEKLPLSVNGKVDRALLPPVTADTGGCARAGAASRSPLEQTLAGIWARVLNVPAVGIHDNFFDLGGASIQTLEVAALAKEKGLTVSAEMLFQYQTVAELAAAVEPEGGSLEREAPSAERPAPSAPEPTPDNLPVVRTPRSALHTPRTGGGMIIESLGIYLPPRVVTTDEVVRNCQQPLNFPLERMTGIHSRRMAGDSEFAIDLAGKAIEDCLVRSAHTPESIDLLICSNISRCDGPGHRFTFEPATAARLQQRFGFHRAIAFDVANACAGTFTALFIVESLLKQGLIRRAMVVSGEYITHLTATAQKEIENFMDPRMACLTLGDSGMALILEQSASDQVGFQHLEMFTRGKYHPLCVAKVTDRPHGGAIMYTDAVTSSAVTIKQAVGHALEVLERRGWAPEDVNSLILHQTSTTTLDGAVQEVNRMAGRTVSTKENTIYNVANRGNTATTTHFVALWDQLRLGRIAPGAKVLFGISGSGQTVGTALYAMDDLPARWQQAPPKQLADAEPRRALRLPRRVRVESIGLVPPDLPGRDESLNLLRAAGSACLGQSRHTANDIELILHTGVYRSSFISEPALAAIAAGELGMNEDETKMSARRTFAFDLTNGAAGPLNACLVAGQMIAAGKVAAAMVMATEVENNAQFWPENTLGLEETGSALILEPSPGDEGFAAFWLQAFPEHVDVLNTYTTGRNNLPVMAIERSPALEEQYLACAAKAVAEFLACEGIQRQEIGLVLPPLRSAAFVRKLAEALGMPLDRFVLPEESAKDAFTSSLAQGFARARAENRCTPGTVALVLAVAAGIQVGCALYYF